MRIFHNDQSNQVVIVIDDCAYTFYAYQHDDIIEAANDYIHPQTDLKGYHGVCKELTIPQTKQTIQKPIIEKPTDSIGQIPQPNTKGRPQCEP